MSRHQIPIFRKAVQDVEEVLFPRRAQVLAIGVALLGIFLPQPCVWAQG